MPMSFDGLAANTSGWSIGPRARGTGSIGCAARIQHSLPIGHYATATAEHREPYESRGSRTVLGAPEGESPSGDSSLAPLRNVRLWRKAVIRDTWMSAKPPLDDCRTGDGIAEVLSSLALFGLGDV